MGISFPPLLVKYLKSLLQSTRMKSRATWPQKALISLAGRGLTGLRGWTEIVSKEETPRGEGVDGGHGIRSECWELGL